MYPWHKRRKDDTIKPHHLAWLDAHPRRTIEWLRERFRDGFDVHHIDGDHDNNDPKNLVLIEHRDHMMLHRNGTRGMGRLCFVRPKNSGRKKKRTEKKAAEAGPRKRQKQLPDVSWAVKRAKEQAAWREAQERQRKADQQALKQRSKDAAVQAKDQQMAINQGLSKWAKLIVHNGMRILVMNDTGKAYRLNSGEIALGIAYSISLDPRRHRRRVVAL